MTFHEIYMRLKVITFHNLQTPGEGGKLSANMLSLKTFGK